MNTRLSGSESSPTRQWESGVHLSKDGESFRTRDSKVEFSTETFLNDSLFSTMYNSTGEWVRRFRLFGPTRYLRIDNVNRYDPVISEYRS